MAGKVKSDQEAAFKSLIGVEQDQENKTNTQPVTKNKSKDRVQRAYFLDRDIDKALRRMALEQGMNLTETINGVLRNGLKSYL